MIQASQPASGVDQDPDRVEADRAGVRAAPSLLAKPCGGEAPQARPLARAKAGQGMLPGAVARQERAHAARLHLGEHERGSIEGDQVDLAPSRANVARKHREAQAFEIASSDLLTKAAERTPTIGVASAPAWHGGGVKGRHGGKATAGLRELRLQARPRQPLEATRRRSLSALSQTISAISIPISLSFYENLSNALLPCASPERGEEDRSAPG